MVQLDETSKEVESEIKKVIIADGPVAKFFGSFPPVVTSLLIGVLIVLLYALTPNQTIMVGTLAVNLQLLVVTAGVPIILSAARGLGVNMTIVSEVIELSGVKLNGAKAPTAAMSTAPDGPGPLTGRDESGRWVSAAPPVGIPYDTKTGKADLLVLRPAEQHKIRRWLI